MKTKGVVWILAVCMMLSLLSGCAQHEPEASFDALEKTGSMELSYATQFSVDYYAGGYKMISLADGSRFFIVPEGAPVPKGVEQTAAVLQQPIQNVYLAATSAMCLFDALGRLDAIALSGTHEDGWYVQNAAEAMRNGQILYAGKYNAPDYELITQTQCPLAIESMMIGHASDIKVQLEQLGIAVFMDQSSNEPHPLGRAEWIKAYAALFNEEEAAERVFSEQAGCLDAVAASAGSGKTVAFFSVNSAGKITARKSGDYVSKMIALAGGTYIFDDLSADGKMSTVTLEPEYFYAQAKDADVLIYNAAIADEITDIAQLTERCALLRDFKAVQTGAVWCTTKSMYQDSIAVGTMIRSIHTILAEDENAVSEVPFFYRLS